MENKDIEISQSLYKDLLKGGTCQYKIGREPREPTLPMQKGLLFEFELIGSTRDGEETPAILTSTGKESVHHSRTIEMANAAKPYLDELGFDLLEVQPSWRCDVDGMKWKGHPDLISSKGIADIKYTEEAASRSTWLRDWLDDSAKIQAVHYTIMSKEIVGRYLPFYFVVFFAWGGIEVIQAQITQEVIDAYKSKVFELVSAYDPDKTSTNFNECAVCKVKDCAFKVTKPTIRKTLIDRI